MAMYQLMTHQHQIKSTKRNSQNHLSKKNVNNTYDFITHQTALSTIWMLKLRQTTLILIKSIATHVTTNPKRKKNDATCDKIRLYGGKKLLCLLG